LNKMNKLENTIYLQATADHDYVVGLRRFFHKYPELSAKEYETAKKIEQELDNIGLEYERVATTGVVTKIVGTGNVGSGKTIVLRADIDALPVLEKNICEYTSVNEGVMHACGHDAHTASLIGSLKILNANKDKFNGTIIATFQPGEEIGYGARIIVDEGIIDGADRVFAYHCASWLKPGEIIAASGPNMAAVDMFKATIKGKSGHICDPDKAIDAVLIASEIVVKAQGIATKFVNPTESALIGIGKVSAGTAYNIIADTAEIEGTIRSLTPKTRKLIKDRLDTLMKQTAEFYGGSCEIIWKDNTSPLINDEKSSNEVAAVAKSLFGEDKVLTKRTPSMMGDDIAEYLIKVPGTYAFVSSTNEDNPNTKVPHHNEMFDINEDSLLSSVLLTSCYTIEYLRNELE